MGTISSLTRAAGQVPHDPLGPDWMEIADDLHHPADVTPTGKVLNASGQTGTLVRNRKTGVYMLASAGGGLRAVPPKWAEKVAAEHGQGPDAIQDRCIVRMGELGLNPNQVAERLGGKISRQHVTDYLSRRKSMGSHKLQHLLPALRLAIQST